MSVWAVSMMRDEEDVAEHVVRHLAEEGVDGILIADNNSADETAKRVLAVANDVSCPVIVIEDPEVGYYQSAKMTKLAMQAHRELGADWIIPFDADEIWYSRGKVGLAATLEDIPSHIGWVNAQLWNHFPSQIDPAGDNPFETIQWRQSVPGGLPKVAFRWHQDAVVQMGNHGIEGVPGVSIDVGVELRHFPYRTFEQFVRKARNGTEAYRATDLPETYGAHWRSYGLILEHHGEEGLREVYDKYFCFLSPVDENMTFDPAPFRRWARLRGEY